ncbi:N-acetylmuramoyl-L-alanine amidase [Sutcliffiella horikoshii]|uniref:N-acetylmuramoyl-L-alanine amidase family protein n=1 Tax=Sutcliffiella horikoshii TaxID=79883 RepID=UPI00384CC5E6
MSIGKFLNLMPHMTTWRVYAIGVSPVSGNEVGIIAPATFGGLSYRIIGNPGTDLYTIQTQSFGTVNIYAPRDNDSTITLVARFDNESNSTGSGSYLNLQPHMTSWRVYPVGVSPVAGNEIGTLAPSRFGGLSYRIINEPSANLHTIETESYGRVNIFAPRDSDSTITNSPQFSNGGNRGSSESGAGQFLNLAPHMTSWRVYPLGVNLVAGNEVGQLAPSRFGGLSYEILGNPSSDVYTILTESFGRVNIYAPRDNDSSITTSPLHLGSADGSSGATHGHYLNLMPHISTWRVYPLGVPLVAGNEVGRLGPSQFGGLSYRILGTVATNSYTINTESFGRVNIFAPRDADSSITATPIFGNTAGNTAPGGGSVDPVFSNPNGVKIFLDAGHGGRDPGASGNGLVEKDVNLAITRELGRILEQNGANVQYRRYYDTYNDLNEIVNKANSSGADLFVSIHCNANPNSSARGTECFTFNPSPSEAALSADISSSISNRLGIPNRGAKQDNFRVITYTTMPAILVETAFLSNSSDANLLRTRSNDFATAIAIPIIAKLGISPVKPILTEEQRKQLVRELRKEKINRFYEVYPAFEEAVDVEKVLPSVEFVNESPFPFNYGFVKGRFIFSTSYKNLNSSNTKIIVKDGKLQGQLAAEIRDTIQKNMPSFDVTFDPDLLEGFALQMESGDIQMSINTSSTKTSFTIVLNMPDLKLDDGTDAGFSITIEIDLDTNTPGLKGQVTEPVYNKFLNYVTSPEFKTLLGDFAFTVVGFSVVVLILLSIPYLTTILAQLLLAATILFIIISVFEKLLGIA